MYTRGMKSFDTIVLIYNPQSTGGASAMAKKLAAQIKKIGLKPTLTPTKRAGHAAELAASITKKYKRPLIISVSGDGGYNEVINGVMEAKCLRPSARPVVAVAGAGNANDHRRVMRSKSLIKLIERGTPKPLDLIHISAVAHGTKLERYAHSYIGFGLTPEVGHELNLHGKTTFDEMRLVVKTVTQLQPFTIVRDGKKRRSYSLVFANISEMAKFIKLDKTNDVRDDKFEAVEIHHRSKLWLLWELLTSVTMPKKSPPSYSTYSFKTTASQPVQLDGEIEHLPANCSVTITSRADAIESLY